MRTKAFFLEFAVIFMITFAITAVVSFGYNLIIHGQSVPNWAVALQFALMFGIICPMVDLMKSERGTSR